MFDDCLFDAEIIADRAGIGNLCTTTELGLLLGSRTEAGARQRVQRELAAGRLPRAVIRSRNRGRNYWTRSQVIGILVRKMREKKTPPPKERPPCGSLRAYRFHLRYGEPTDELCRSAYREHRREYDTAHADEINERRRRRRAEKSGRC